MRPLKEAGSDDVELGEGRRQEGSGAHGSSTGATATACDRTLGSWGEMKMSNSQRREQELHCVGGTPVERESAVGNVVEHTAPQTWMPAQSSRPLVDTEPNPHAEAPSMRTAA